MKINKEGTATILLVGAIQLIVTVSSVLYWSANAEGAPLWLKVLLTLLIVLTTAAFALVVYFFRDPERNVPTDDNLLISPADGKIVGIIEVNESRYLKTSVKQLSIFLSPLNVHVNRVPATGKLEFVQYFPGKYLMAWNPKSSELNERAEFGLLHASGTRILFRQITGFLARRIVFNLKEEQMAYAGDRFGMMKFGSRMDILVPKDFVFEVKDGQHVVAGETILGYFKAAKS